MSPRTPRVAAAREAIRRILIWGLVAVFFVLAIHDGIAYGSTWVLLAWSGWAVVGGIVLHARRGNTIGRLLLGVALVWPIYGLYEFSGLAGRLPVWVELIAVGLGSLVWIAIGYLVIVFPTGRVETRLGKVVAWLLAGLAAVVLVFSLLDQGPLQYSGRPNPIVVDGGGAVSDFIQSDVSFLIVPAVMLAAVVDLAARWRASTGTRRLQFRWLAFGAAVVVLVLMAAVAFTALPEPLAYVLIVGFNALPVSIGIAITRHGLYEIGRVVSRTVSYAVVTVLAIAVYALVVTSISWLLPGLPAIGVAIATLAAAAAFLPALRWVQRRLDRRFDRARYDAEKVVDAFGRRLRDGADPASTPPELAVAVERALAPASVGVWTPREITGAPR